MKALLHACDMTSERRENDGIVHMQGLDWLSSTLKSMQRAGQPTSVGGN